MAHDKNWINNSLRIAAKQSRMSNEKIDQNFKRFTVDFHCNVEQLNHIYKGNDPKDPDAYSGEFIEELHGEILDRYVADAHERGIKIISYFLLHQLFEKGHKEHPEWLQVKKNGEPIRTYGCDYGGCPSSSWADYSIRRIKDLCKHDIDGIFLDGPAFFWDCCYCDSCKEKFRDKYHKELGDATHAEFMKFHVEEITNFIANIRSAINDVNPNIILYLNNSALRNDCLGSNTRRLSEYVDIIGAEGGFQPAEKAQSMYICSASAKDIEDKAEGKPTVIFTKAERTPSAFVMHSAAETKRILAQTVANGANIWYGIHGPIKNVDSPAGQAAKNFFNFLKENEQFYANTKNVADAAIMWSMPTANYYASSVDAGDFTGDGRATDADMRADHHAEYMGFVEMLEHNHILFDSIDDVSVETRLSKYSLVVLPSCAAMSEGNKQALRDFVRNGGTVIASFDTGVLDENGTHPDASFMEELFGIKYMGVIKRASHVSYMELCDDAFPNIESTVMTSNLAITIQPTTAQTLARYYAVLPGTYKELKDLTTPSITSNTYGKGKAILIAENMGLRYTTHCPPQLCQMFDCLTNKVLSKTLKTNAPSCVEITLREQENAYILHVVNNTVDGCRPIQTNIPVYDLEFEVKVGSHLSKAVALNNENIQFAPTTDGAKITLQKLTDYTAIVVYK